ncbi:cytosolic non-specific dipeptidase-like [Drosophila pseudoobscura]|uniref:Cytosolic non-specific dipeptidase-like n=1 Tax=Drosophila pseudoobscura pseudoobscura TaxID=46245 RepID=A0A6I8V0R4_DROPS|nr:cytosolic non-specific dipeptidase [Drosophila pseudoobscura]
MIDPKTHVRLPRRSKRSSSRVYPGSDEELKVSHPEACRCEHCLIKNRPKWTDEDNLRASAMHRQVDAAIEKNFDEALADLEDFVRLKSVSADVECITESLKAMCMYRDRLERMRFTIYEYNINIPRAICDTSPHPKVIFAHYFSSPTKNTVLVYAYLDVAPAKFEDGWLSEPFEFYMNDDMLYGRGVSTGKGMAVCWLQAIETWLEQHGDLPINIKFIVEIMHAVGSVGLQHYIEVKREFFQDVDCIVFGNNSWINDERPLMSCSLTGWAHFGLEMRGGAKSIEGASGGLVYEPMTDVCTLMNSLVDNLHVIQIPAIQNMVRPTAVTEWTLLESAIFSEYAYKDQFGIRRLRYELTKAELLHNRWCQGTMTMHGIEGSFSRKGSCTALPMSVMGKFSIKLLPDQMVSLVQTHVEEFLHTQYEDLKIRTTLKIHLLDACDPYSWGIDARYSKALVRSISRVYQVEPDLSMNIVTCLPIASTFHKITGKPIILIPYAQRMDYSHVVNESIPKQCFLRNIKVCTGLILEMSLLPARCKCDVIFEYCNRRGIAEMLKPPVQSSQKHSVFSHMRRTKSMKPLNKHPEEHETNKRKRLKDWLCAPFRRHRNNHYIFSPK